MRKQTIRANALQNEGVVTRRMQQKAYSKELALQIEEKSERHRMEGIMTAHERKVNHPDMHAYKYH